MRGGDEPKVERRLPCSRCTARAVLGVGGAMRLQVRRRAWKCHFRVNHVLLQQLIPLVLVDGAAEDSGRGGGERADKTPRLRLEHRAVVPRARRVHGYAEDAHVCAERNLED